MRIAKGGAVQKEQHPEARHEGPYPAVVIPMRKVLAMALQVGTPETLSRWTGIISGYRGVGVQKHEGLQADVTYEKGD
jgi:hypothetical protein